MDAMMIYMPIIMAVLGLAYVFVRRSWVMKQDAGDGKMKEISDHIYVGALAFLNALSGSEKMSSPLNMLNIAVNVRRAFVGNSNQKPYFYHPDTWHDGGGDFIFIPKVNLKK